MNNPSQKPAGSAHQSTTTSVFKTKFKPLLATAVSQRPFRRLPRDNVLIVALLFAVLGSYTILHSRAATPAAGPEIREVIPFAAAIRSKDNPSACLDVASGKAADGTPVRLLACNNSRAQQWSHQYQPDGSMRLSTLGHCLHAAGGGTAGGSQILLWRCLDGPAQLWTYDASGTLRNVYANKCLFVASGAPIDTRPTLKACDAGDPGQLWSL